MDRYRGVCNPTCRYIRRQNNHAGQMSSVTLRVAYWALFSASKFTISVKALFSRAHGFEFLQRNNFNQKEHWDSGKPARQQSLFCDIQIKVVINCSQIYVYHTDLLPIKIYVTLILKFQGHSSKT